MLISKVRLFCLDIVKLITIIVLILLLGLLLPATPKAKHTFLYSTLFKDSLMQYVPSPRIILIGGSGLAMGINSKYLSYYSDMNVVNAGIAKSIGIVYTMDNSLNFIRQGDIIVLCPEYHNYFGRFAYGNSYLARTILDTQKEMIFKLRLEQYLNILPHIPYYLLTKFKPSEYTFIDTQSTYDMSAFNIYGDMCNHWPNGSRINSNSNSNLLGGRLNLKLTTTINEYSDRITSLGAHLFVTYPVYQQSSFESSLEQIELVVEEYSNINATILGSAERYMFPDSLMYGTAYHISMRGTLLRTKLLLEDLRYAGVF